MTQQTEALSPPVPTAADAPPVPRALLIDIDNCPKHMEHLPKNLDGFSRIVVCYANSIKGHFGLGKVTEAEPIIKVMIELQLINIAGNGKVTYPELQANGYDDDFDDDIPF